MPRKAGKFGRYSWVGGNFFGTYIDGHRGRVPPNRTKFHGVALHEAIGVFTRHAFLGERDQYPLRVNQPAKLVEVSLHSGGVDNELVDDRYKTRERKIKRDGCVGSDHAHWGLTLGPATGRLIVEMMTGETPFCDPTPYRAERFS